MAENWLERSTGGYVIRALVSAALETHARGRQLPIIYIDLLSRNWIGPIGVLSRFSGYCRVMWDNAASQRDCHEDHLRRSAETGQAELAVCHAGRLNYQVPVFEDGTRVGALLAGQFVPCAGMRDEAAGRHRQALRRLPVGSPERDELSRQFARGLSHDGERVPIWFSDLASWIGDCYGVVRRMFPSERLTPGAIEDPWSMMQHELQNASQTVRARAEAMKAELERPPSEAMRRAELAAVAGDLYEDIGLFDMLLMNFFGDQALGYPRKRRMDLVAILRRAITAFKAQAALKGVGMKYYGPGQLIMDGSEQHLQLAALNLIGNAVKYSYRGAESTERWVRVDAACDDGMAEVAIRNYGVGILPEEMGRVFDRFERGEIAREERGSGSGIGLHVVRQVVIAHGGGIEVESLPQTSDDRGPHLVTFRLTLPIGRVK